MEALHLVASWPVEHVTAAVVTPDGVEAIGDTERVYRLASLTKPIVAWAIMVAVEEAVIDLDALLEHVDAPDGATMRHLLAHAAGFGFDGPDPVSEIERKRVYSNTGIERAADELAGASGIPFANYLQESVLDPLGMTTATLQGSPAHGISCNLADVATFVAEMLRPRLIASQTRTEIATPQFPGLAGIVPNVGRFDPCPWGLGVEIRGAKSPHWTGASISAATFGHFGGSGSMMWVDPSVDAGVVALTTRPVPRLARRSAHVVAAVLRRRGRRAAERRLMFQPGDRVRWESMGDDGLPLVRYGFVGGTNGDHTRIAVMLDGDLAGDTVVEFTQLAEVSITTVVLHLHGADLLDDPSLHQGLVNLWSAEADQAGLEIRSLECLQAAVRDAHDRYSLAELWAGSDRYVLHASADTQADIVSIRAVSPNS